MLLADLLIVGLQMGPVTTTRMSTAATLGMPWGISYAGGQGVIQGVAAGDANGVARMTTLLVQLGMEKTIAGIVINLVDRQQAEVVALVCLEMTKNQSIQAVTVITTTILSEGRLDVAAAISSEMAKHGNSQFMEVLSAAKEQYAGNKAAEEGKKSKPGEDLQTSHPLPPAVHNPQRDKPLVDQIREGAQSVRAQAADSGVKAAEAERNRREAAKPVTQRVGEWVTGNKQDEPQAAGLAEQVKTGASAAVQRVQDTAASLGQSLQQGTS